MLPGNRYARENGFSRTLGQLVESKMALVATFVEANVALVSTKTTAAVGSSSDISPPAGSGFGLKMTLARSASLGRSLVLLRIKWGL
jgi:hypothetical protein